MSNPTIVLATAPVTAAVTGPVERVGGPGEWDRRIAEAIIVFLHRAGMTRKILCRVSGLNYQTLASRLLGRTSFTQTELQLIATALDVTPFRISHLASRLEEV